jgi:predicted aldo/keto reductase-like oxidoreductase
MIENSFFPEIHGKASECIKCGKCEKVCPQHLQIRDLLKDVAKTFEA